MRNRMYLLIAFTTLFLASPIFADENKAAMTTHWGYLGEEGPTHWANLNPAFAACAAGKEQSPIDIPTDAKLVTNDLEIHSSAVPTFIIKHGDQEMVIGKTKVLVHSDYNLQVNYPPNGWRNIVEYKGKTYSLSQYHFHVASENKWHGRAYPAEIHFVYQSTHGALLVIGVFIEKGRANKALQSILAQLPNDVGHPHRMEKNKLVATDLLPKHRDYYAFAGSLTTPPCIEGVQWVVLANPITASSAQLNTLKQAVDGGNARPVQTLNARAVEYGHR